MFMIVDKMTSRIVDKVENAEYVSGKWIRLSHGALIQINFVDIIEVNEVPSGDFEYFYNSKFIKKSPKEYEVETVNIKTKLQELDNPRDAEELFIILKSKGILNDTDLDPKVKERFNQKFQLRQQLQEL